MKRVISGAQAYARAIARKREQGDMIADLLMQSGAAKPSAKSAEP